MGYAGLKPKPFKALRLFFAYVPRKSPLQRPQSQALAQVSPERIAARVGLYSPC
jgi:hypothetical protein